MQYPIIEAVVAILWIAAMLAYGPTARFVEAVVLGTILLGIAVTDARHYLIPDEYNWAGLIIGLGASLTAGVPGVKEAVLGAATGLDRKSTRLNSSHLVISYAVFFLKKKKILLTTQ